MATKRVPRKEGRHREKRTLLTIEEEQEIDDTLHEARQILGFRLNYSELCRAALTLVLQHEDKFFAELRKARLDLKKPQTTDLDGAIDFEIQLAEIMEKAVRRRK